MSGHSRSSSSSDSDGWRAQRLALTMRETAWDVILAKACEVLPAEPAEPASAHWGEVIDGLDNIVRFLHVGNDTIVARVPMLDAEKEGRGRTEAEVEEDVNSITSEVATMKFIETHTSIPVPHIIYWSVDPLCGGPYILMTKVEGIPLVEVWDDMEDTKREAILRQVVNIFLQLLSHRFNRIGALFLRDPKQEGPEWVVDGLVSVTAETGEVDPLSRRTFGSAVECMVEQANATLRQKDQQPFIGGQQVDYVRFWILRSFIPQLYDSSLDQNGFPLVHNQFHSENIFITDLDTPSPRISGILDWAGSKTRPTSSATQFPLFIVDHPQWSIDDPRRSRNPRDQATFIRLIKEAEGDDHTLSRAFESSRGVYMMEQMIFSEWDEYDFFEDLMVYCFGGPDAERSEQDVAEVEGVPTTQQDDNNAIGGTNNPSPIRVFCRQYMEMLEDGLLRPKIKYFWLASDAFEEAKAVLGADMMASVRISKKDFDERVRRNLDLFPETGKVRQWLAKHGDV